MSTVLIGIYCLVSLVVLCFGYATSAESGYAQLGPHVRHQNPLEPGAIIMLVSNWAAARPGRKCSFNQSIDAISTKLNPHNPYPVILMGTEQWTREDMVAIRRRWDTLDIKFINVAKWFMSVPGEQPDLEDKEKPLSSINYKRMCHFFFKGFTEVPLLMRYRYLLRMDDDTCLLDNVNYDIFRYAAHYRAAYAYTHIWHDKDLVTKGLYQFVDSHVAAHNLTFANHAEHTAVTRRASFPGTVPCYNTNFELINTVRYRDPAVMQFVDAVAQSNMIFHRRWGDAPLRYATALLFWKPTEVLRLAEFEIQHSGWPAFQMTEYPDIGGPNLRHRSRRER